MPNELPLNWCECKFEDVLDYEQPTRYIVSNTDYQEQGIAVLTAGKSFILGYTDEKDGIFDASKETVIIFDDFTTASKLVDFPFKVKSSAMKILHAKKDININFLYYLMQTIHYESDTHKRYWISEYAKQTLNLPPLAEQERIVAKIEALFAGIDEGVERLKSAQAQIKQYRQSVLKSAFEQCKHKGTINDIAQLTKIGPFGSLLHKSDYVKNGIPLVNPSHIKNLTILPNKDICVLPSKLKQLQSYVLKKYDIVIGRRGEMGRCAVVDEQQEGWLCGTGSMFLRLKKENYPYFYALYIASQQCIQYLERNAMGTTMKNLNEKIIKKVPIPLPTLPEQQRIVEEIEKRFAVADVLEKAVNDGLEKADKLKQSILKRAFEGKLAPQNPNDEPASVLLERIKKSQKPTKGKKK